MSKERESEKRGSARNIEGASSEDPFEARERSSRTLIRSFCHAIGLFFSLFVFIKSHELYENGIISSIAGQGIVVVAIAFSFVLFPFIVFTVRDIFF